MGADAVFCFHQPVHSPDGGILVPRRVDGPIAGSRNQQLWSRSYGRSDIDVVDIKSQMPLVLTPTPTLHACRNHVHDRGCTNALINCREKKGLGTPSGGTGTADAARIHVRQLRDEIDRAYTVPQLHPHHADAPQVLAISP